MANVFLKTDGAKSVSTDARDKLKTLFEIFPWILPVELVLGEMVSYVRALGQAKIFIITQVGVLYFIHFLVMWLLLWNTDLQGKGIAINLGITYAVMVLVTLLVCYLTDWRKVSVTLRKDFLEKSAMPPTGKDKAEGEEGDINVEMCDLDLGGKSETEDRDTKIE